MARYNGSDSAAERKVMQEIVGAGSDGIWQKEVAQQTDLNRSYVSEIASWLKSRGKIAILRVGNRSKYYAKTEKVRDPVLGPLLQGRYAFKELVKKKRWILGKDVLKINADGLSKVQLSLIMFSLSLGVLMTYLLLQSTSKGNMILADAYYGKLNHSIGGKKPEHGERVMRDWIKAAVSSTVPLMPVEFLNVVYGALAQGPMSHEDRKKLLYRVSRLEIDEATARQVYNEFRSMLDSRTTMWLDRISQGLPGFVENETMYIERAEKQKIGSPSSEQATAAGADPKFKRRNGHRHKFNVTEVRDEHYYETCEICGEERPSLRRKPKQRAGIKGKENG